MDHLAPLPSAQAEFGNVCDNICHLIKIHTNPPGNENFLDNVQVIKIHTNPPGNENFLDNICDICQIIKIHWGRKQSYSIIRKMAKNMLLLRAL